MDLKALQAIRTSPLVQRRQKALNDISTHHAVGLYWVSGHAGLQVNETVDGLTSGCSTVRFGPELALGLSRQDIRRDRCWLVNQHWVRWQGLGITQRQI
jgi:hypothetical protein